MCVLVTQICFSVNCLFLYLFPCYCTLFWRNFSHITDDNTLSIFKVVTPPPPKYCLPVLSIDFVYDTFTLMKKIVLSNLLFLPSSFSVQFFCFFLSAFSFSHLVNKCSPYLDYTCSLLHFLQTLSSILFIYTDNSCIHLEMTWYVV